MKHTLAAFVLILCARPAWAALPSDAVIATADFSALPFCDQIGADLRDNLGRRWQIDFSGNQYKVLIDSVWHGDRAHVLIRQGANIYILGQNNRLYLMLSPDARELTWFGDAGCRLPASTDGSSVLQQNTYLVDAVGGTWVAQCSEEVDGMGRPLHPATYCPDFPGATLQEGAVTRNGYHLPPSGLRSMPEPDNAPWNLRWCNGQMFVHLYNPDRSIHQAGLVTVSPGAVSVRAAMAGECGYLSAVGPSAPTAPTNLRVVR
jgi:hypothetical protein